MSELVKKLDRLCWHFEDLLERQETMLAIVHAQGQAALRQDLEYLDAKTAALSALIQENVAAEQERLELVKALVTELQLPPESQTLSGLILAAPQPYSQRLSEFQGRMRAVLGETRLLVRDNSFVLRRAINLLGDAVNTLAQCLPAPAGQYDQSGQLRTAAGPGPALLDSRG